MIYTVTFNPAIDYLVHTETLVNGAVNRSSYENITIGGKGINVSIILSELGIESKVLGFTAGFTGEAIENGLAEMGISSDFIRLPKGNSRINVKIYSGTETELNGQGPDIDRGSLSKLFEKLSALSSEDTLILAGSIPKSLPDNVYESILSRITDKNVRTVVDATGELLLKVLKYRPFLIKPNDIELGEIFRTVLRSEKDILFHAKKLQAKGARNVLVSMAENGALLLCEDGTVLKQSACSGTVRNSVGAGDSMLAGFLAGLFKGSYEYALRLGTACGGATAFSDDLAKKEQIDALMEQLL